MIRLSPSWPLNLRPLAASLLLIAAALGSIVLVGILLLTLIPLVVVVGGLVVWGVAAMLAGWAGIEAMAAMERWLERDPRFQR